MKYNFHASSARFAVIAMEEPGKNAFLQPAGVLFQAIIAV
jgi:hypothetical protein